MIFFKNLQIHRKTSELKPILNEKTLTQVFSCKFCKTFKNTVFREHLQKTASEKLCI